MDPAEIRFVRKAFIKKRGAEVFRKSCPSCILWEPLGRLDLPVHTEGRAARRRRSAGDPLYHGFPRRSHLGD